jgi:hypothetical protein
MIMAAPWAASLAPQISRWRIKKRIYLMVYPFASGYKKIIRAGDL